MSTRTITGNLAIDPEVVRAGSIQITKLRNHREHRRIPPGQVAYSSGYHHPLRRGEIRDG